MTEKPKTASARPPPGKGVSAVDDWNHAVREAYMDEPELPAEARAMLEATDEEVLQKLRAAGVDLAELDAQADATYDAMVAKLAASERPKAVPQAASSENDVGWVAPVDGDAKVVSLEKRRERSRAVWLVYAVAAAVATVGTVYAVGHQQHDPVEVPRNDLPPVEPPPPVAPPPPAVHEQPAPAPLPAEPADKAPSDKAPSDKAPSDKAPH